MRYRASAGRMLFTVAVAAAAAIAPQTFAYAQLPGADATLTRAPYLSDLTATSVRVSWAMSTQTRGTVAYGPLGSCSANTVSAATLGNPITVNGVREYQNSVAVTGLAAGTTYCYRIFTGDAVPVDLLGANPTPRFTTLDSAGAATPVTFAVFGDWGDTTNSGVNDGSLNVNQAAVDARLASSGARFVLSTGDVGYPSGSQTNYGDLNQTGANISAVFGPSYWAVPGQSVPLYGVSGNHGQNASFLSTWPQAEITASSGGTYAMVDYPSIEGTTPATYPTTYFAFSTGDVRVYVLDAAWSDMNVGTATGGSCGSHCRTYEIDREAHWSAASAQYQWLAQDLAAHPGGVKVAAFHFPLRSDDSGQPSDAYLQNTPGSSDSLEQLLHDNGVQLVFNGHAHLYQRNVAPPGGVISYVSGGGGAKATSIGGHGCATTDAYGIGWSYTKGQGNACGGAPAPATQSQVYHFLKVTVSGTSVTVMPTDSAGNTFDVQTYNFGPDTVLPSAPANVAASQPGASTVSLSWDPATDNIGVSAYDVYRNGSYLATTAPAVTGYTDTTITAGSGYTYQVRARDLAGNTRAATVTVNGGASDTVPPSVPTGITASATGPTGASLAWTASTDDVGVTGYTVLRNGSTVASLPATTTSWNDVDLLPGTGYTYQVSARDEAGNVSAPSDAVTVSTPADIVPPSAPGTPSLVGLSATEVAMAWTGSVDNVGVVRYDVLRDGVPVGAASGTTFADATVAPATTYTYAVRAVDPAGNSATSGGLTLTTPDVGTLFFDGFESGALSQWNTVTGLAVQSSIVHAGTWAVQETSTGTATYAYKTLPASYTELWGQAWVYVVSRSTSANLFGFRASSGASIVNVYLDTNGRVSLRNNAGGVTTYGSTTITAGGWHRVVLHALVNATSSSLDVLVDGVAVPGLTLTGQNLGTNPIARFQLGETTTGRTYDIVLDDVTASPVSL